MAKLMAATAPGAASTGTEAGPGVAVTAAEDMKRELKAWRKAKGNELLMSPLLMHNLNLFNMRVQLLVGRPLWTQFSMLTSKKVTPAHHARWLSGEATGMGEQFLRQVWAGAVRNARELEQLGLSVTEDSRPIFVGPEKDPDSGMWLPGISAESIPSRLMSFLLHVTTARFWSTAEFQWRWPKAFAGLLPRHCLKKLCPS